MDRNETNERHSFLLRDDKTILRQDSENFRIWHSLKAFVNSRLIQTLTSPVNSTCASGDSPVKDPFPDQVEDLTQSPDPPPRR